MAPTRRRALRRAARDAGVGERRDPPRKGNASSTRWRQDGKVSLPFQKTFWSAGFGMVVDRFGIPWMVNCEQAA